MNQDESAPCSRRARKSPTTEPAPPAAGELADPRHRKAGSKGARTMRPRASPSGAAADGRPERTFFPERLDSMTTLTMNSPGFDDRAEETRLRGYARGMMATIVEFDDLCEVTGTCSHAELQYLLGRLIRLVDDLGHVVVVGRRLAGGGRPGRPPS